MKFLFQHPLQIYHYLITFHLSNSYFIKLKILFKCYSIVYPEHIYQLSQICHNIQTLSITLNNDVLRLHINIGDEDIILSFISSFEFYKNLLFLLLMFVMNYNIWFFKFKYQNSYKIYGKQWKNPYRFMYKHLFRQII